MSNRYERPSKGYVPQPGLNSNKFERDENAGRGISATDIDADFGAVYDVLNEMYQFIMDKQIAAVPGVEDIDNKNKVLVHAGESGAVWDLIGSENLKKNAVTWEHLPRSTKTSIIATGEDGAIHSYFPSTDGSFSVVMTRVGEKTGLLFQKHSNLFRKESEFEENSQNRKLPLRYIKGVAKYGLIDGTSVEKESFDATHLKGGAADNRVLAADAVDGSKVKNRSLVSSNYGLGSVDGDALGDAAVKNKHIAVNEISADKLAGDIPHEKLGLKCVRSQNVAEATLTGDHMVNSSIPMEKLKGNPVQLIEDNTLPGTAIVQGSVTNNKLADNCTGSRNYQQGSILGYHINLQEITDRHHVPKSITGKSIANAGLAYDNFPYGHVIFPWCYQWAPDGWFDLDGGEYRKDQYPDFWQTVKNWWEYEPGHDVQANSSSTHFKVRDLRGYVPAFSAPTERGGVALSANAIGVTGAIGSKYGEATHQLTVNEMPLHHHGLVTIGGDIASKRPDSDYHQVFPPEKYKTLGPEWLKKTYKTEDAGGNNPHNNVQPTVLLRGIIKLR